MIETPHVRTSRGQDGVSRLGAVACVLFSALLAPSMVTRASAQPIVQPGDMHYLGSFRVPSGFEFSGMGLAFNPANNSLFMAGNRETAELRIPAIGGTASFVQPLRDAYGGRIGNIGGSDPRVGGHLVYNGRLYLSAYVYYDAGLNATASHFVRSSLSLSSGSVSGPIRVGNMNPGFYSGYMAPVPAEWQAALGGPAVTGNCCLSIISRTSYGPALFAFNPESMGNARPLLYYDEGHQTLGAYGLSGSHPVFNGSTRITGVVLPPGTGSALFFGATGVGNYCYGTGASCNDPESPYQGEHAYPYRGYVWAYRLSDLAAVRSGAKEPWQITPYATWQLSQLGNVKQEFGVGGAAYDPATRRLYVAQRCGADPGGSCSPLIHVYELGVGSAGSAPPPSAGGVLTRIDNPTQGQSIRPPFLLTGWSLDTRAPGGPGVLFLQAWAVPHASGRAPIYLGWVNPTQKRDDVAAAHGNQFRYSGFNLALSNIPPGQYTLAFFPYSLVTGSFENDRVTTVPVNVLPGVTTMIDAPVWGQVYSNRGVGMVVSGWAVDARSAGGTGIDAVHVWAVNAETGAGTFLGAAGLGVSRSEPASLFGSSRFRPSGFSLTNGVRLNRGTYYLLVLSHSVGATTFNVATMTAAIVQ